MNGAERHAGRSGSGEDTSYRKCRFIPPHQSLTRQLPPKGKPFLHCANRANMTLSCGSPLRSALIRRLRHQTACSLAPKATDEGGRYCSRSSSCCVARKDSCKKASPWGEAVALATDEGGINLHPRIAYKASRLPPTKRARQPHSSTTPYLPRQQKSFPHVPATHKKRNKFSPCKWRGHGGSSR